MSSQVLGSVIIPAHNEAAVIRDCLEALTSGVPVGTFEVIVVCNGCSDDTADRARSVRYPVAVLELEHSSKPAALRLAESSTQTFPRLYLDADVLLSGSSAATVLRSLRTPGVDAGRPPAVFDTTASSAVVRRFHRARAAVPSLHTSLWGAGVYGLSEEGRARFGPFPDVIGDDLFVDRLFKAREVRIVACPPVTVQAPQSTRDLVKILARSSRGKREADVESASDRSSTLATLAGVLRHGIRSPNALVDTLVFIVLTTTARAAGRWRGGERWERDEGSRLARNGNRA